MDSLFFFFRFDSSSPFFPLDFRIWICRYHDRVATDPLDNFLLPGSSTSMFSGGVDEWKKIAPAAGSFTCVLYFFGSGGLYSTSHRSSTAAKSVTVCYHHVVARLLDATEKT